MNKKFFGFLIVVAALFSVCTLESCKDTNTDLTHEQMIKCSEQYQALSNRINSLEADLNNKCSMADVDNKYGNEINGIKNDLAAAKKALEAASTQADLDALKATLDNADAALQALINELSGRIDNLAKQARSINVKGVYTNFGTFNTPFGINNGLVVAYLPSFDGGELCGVELPDELFDDVFAGTIYLTVNPVSTDFEGLSVDLVTTAGNAAPGFTLSPLVKSDEEIQFGIGTRANQYLYETQVLANVDDVERFSLDKEGAIETVKRVIDNKSINFRELGNVALETLLNTKLDAYLVSLNQGDSVTLASDELLAAVAVEPLNFTHMDALGTVLDKVKALAEAKIEAFKAQINDFNIDIDILSDQKTFDDDFNIKFNQNFVVPGKVDVDINFDTQDWNVNITDTTISVGIDTTYHVSIEIPSVEIDGLDKINDFKSIIETMVDKATAGLDKLERLTIIANPAMFVMDEAGKFCALSTNPNKPTEVNSSEVVFYPTSYCLETVVPYFAKYVKVGSEEAILPGEDASFAVELGKGVVEIEYAAIDYAGNQSVVRKYYVKVVE